MSSPESQSKRERQKARRQEKLAQQAVISQRERRNRMLAFLAIGLVLLGLIGYSVLNRINANKAADEKRRESLAQLDELGCTPDEIQEDAGQGHLDGSSLGDQPPDTLYPERPAASGQHFGNWIKTGVYDQLIDERALVHNLEHGYVVGYYDEGADEDAVTDFKDYVESQIEGTFKKLIVAPWDGELPGTANFAYVAWNQRQMCEEFDKNTFEVFMTAHHSSAGEAPERTLSAHLEEGNGTIDPGDEPFLLPPLGQGDAPVEGMSELQATEGATEGSE